MRSSFRVFISIFTLFVLCFSGLQTPPASAKSTHAVVHASALALSWNIFLNSSGVDTADNLITDTDGNIYVVGSSAATWGNPLKNYADDEDVIVAKVSPAGNVIWHTFLGGAALDRGTAVLLDGNGGLYVLGYSYGGNWGGIPLVEHTTLGSQHDGFITKMNASTGAKIWHTFFGGSSLDTAYGAALDESGNIYAVGRSDGTWGNPVNPYIGFMGNSFAAKFNSSGALVWNTFIGGTGFDQASSVIVHNGNVFVGGGAGGNWDTPVRAYTANGDGFITSLNTATGVENWHTFLGSAGDLESVFDVEISSPSTLLVVGDAKDTWGSPLATFQGGTDAFLAELDLATGALNWNTFIGSAADETGFSLAIDPTGYILIAGSSTGGWGTPARAYTAGKDGYVAYLNPSGEFLWNTFLGGSADDVILDVETNLNGNVITVGDSYATWGNPVFWTYTSQRDGFVAGLTNINTVSELSNGSLDGWILESGEKTGKGGKKSPNASTLNLGDDSANKQYRSLISFDTSVIPDSAQITSVTLKIKRAGSTGAGNPINALKGIVVDIRTGDFGSSALALTDFKTAANKESETFKPAISGGWYSINLTKSADYINTSGNTQMRLKFKLDDNDNFTANILKIYSGNASVENRPQLIVEYYVP